MAKAKELTNRDKIEALLTKVAKANKCEVARAIPHGASKSGIGALQARRDGAVLISVRDRDVVVYVDPKTLKAGRPGPKGWEHIAHFNHNVPLEIFKKSFEKAFKEKKLTGSKPKASPKDITAQRKALEAKLALLKKEEQKAKKAKPAATVTKRKQKAKTKTNPVTDAAVAAVAATN